MGAVKKQRQVLKRGKTSSTFARKVDRQEQEHASLATQLDKLMTRDPVALTWSLLKLRSFLLKHFAREEGPQGLFELVMTRAWQHQNKVRDLRHEHGSILTMIDEVLAYTKQRFEPISDGQHGAVLQLIGVLKSHEACENEMLQDVLQTDVGVGD